MCISGGEEVTNLFTRWLQGGSADMGDEMMILGSRERSLK